MALVIEHTTSESSGSAPAMLEDGRDFLPDLGDSGHSYEKLLRAVGHTKANEAL
jgi:hypothetical protein